MQWKSIAEDGMPDARLVVFVTFDYSEPCYAMAQLVNADRSYLIISHSLEIKGREMPVIEGRPSMQGLMLNPGKVPPVVYTHYLVLEPPEVV